MASRQSVSSILKPSKVRAPLKEIEPIDQDDDENTATIAKRRVSFSGTNKIKMYNTGATSLTVHQAPMIDEQFSILSDSSNAEKTKLSGKFEKSDGQITFESTNSTNVENNGRVIIEYESPVDNMEITETLPGKIFSDTIYTINNESEHFGYNSNDSESNMEFTEAVKIGTIITTSVESDLDETLNNESEEHPEVKFDFQPSTSIPDLLAKNTSNISSYSGNMDFTYATKKSYTMDLTCMSNKQTFDENSETDYNHSQNFINMEPGVSREVNDNSDNKSETIQNDILCSEIIQINNCSNNQTTDCGYKNNNDNVIEQLSLSVISMDIDPTLGGIEYDNNHTNVNSELLVNEQKNLITSTTIEKQNNGYEVECLQNNSNKIDINNKPSLSTGMSFVQEKSPEQNVNESVIIEEQLHRKILHAQATTLEQNKSYEKDPPLVVEEIIQKKYSRKTMVHTVPPLVVQKKLDENEDLSDVQTDMCVITNENQQNTYSRKSIAPVSGFSQIQPFGNDTISSTTSIYSQTQPYGNDTVSSTTSTYSQTQSVENDIADTFVTIEKNQHKNYSRKSMGPSIFTREKCSEDSLSDISFVSEESNKIPLSVDNLSLTSDSSNTQQIDVFNSAHNKEQSVLKNKHQSLVFNGIIEDDLNSPFRKKLKKSIVPTHLTKQFDKCTNTLIEEIIENEPVTNNDVSENVNVMDTSVKCEFNNENIANVSSEEISMTLSSPSNEIFCKRTLESSINEDTSFINDSFKHKSLKMENKYEKYKEKIDMKNNETNLNEQIENNELFEENDKENKETNNEFIQMNDDTSKANNVSNLISCIEEDIIKEVSINDKSVMDNVTEIDLIKEKPIKEHLCRAVLEFLTRWNDKFVEQKLVLHKCTNREWLFDLLDNNIILLISYAPILNENSLLKIEDISFTTKTITQNEIITFGINWILSKYNPKVYKQMCYTARDVEVLLTSLLDDVQYISMVMKNFTFLRDLYSITFKNGKAQFLLHSMKNLLMARIEISLSNIHKLSVKDITVDCLFGVFDVKILDKIMENVPRDYKVLQSIVEKLNSPPIYNVSAI